MGAKTLLTVDQFEQLPEEEAIRHELDEGELVDVSGATYQHNSIRDHLIEILRAFLRAGRLGRVIAEQEFRLSPDTVRRPDVALIGPANLASVEPEKSIQTFAPDLAVEISSPSDSFDALARKTRQYLAAGTKTVWIIAASVQEIHVFTKAGRAVVLEAGDALTEPDLLPGFSLAVRDLFEG